MATLRLSKGKLGKIKQDREKREREATPPRTHFRMGGLPATPKKPDDKTT